jgi:hypothetical protein
VISEDDYCALADSLEERGARYLTIDGRTGWFRDGQYLGRTATAAKDTIRSGSTEDAS